MKKDILIQIESKKIEISSCEEIANLYNERLNNKSLDDLEVMLMTETYQNQAFNLVSDLLKNISSCESIFDIGCGYGCLLKFLREK